MSRFVLFLIGVGVAVGVTLPLWLVTLWSEPTSLLAFVHHFASTAMLWGIIASALGALFMPEHYLH